MALGHLHLYYGAGRQETVPLVKSLTTIGQADDNDIVIPHSNVSDHHVRIVIDQSGCYLSDLESVSGTYVNGVRLPVRTPQRLSNGSLVRLGDVRMIVNLESQPTLVPVEPPADLFLTQLLNATSASAPAVVHAPTVPVDTIQTTLVPATLSVEAGSMALLTIMVTNTTTSSIQVVPAVTGLPSSWVNITPNSLALAPHTQASAKLHIRPPRDSESRAGQHVLSVQILDPRSGNMVSETEGAITITPFGGFEVELRQATPEAWQDSYLLNIHNTSNQEQGFRLQGRTTANSLHFDLDSAHTVVAPGSTKQVHVRVAPRVQRWIGSSETLAFAIDVLPDNSSLAPKWVKGKLTFKPPIPLWLAATAIPTVVVLVIALVLLLQDGAIQSLAGSVSSSRTTAVPPTLVSTRTTALVADAIGVAGTATLPSGVNANGTTTTSPQPEESASAQKAQSPSTSVAPATKETVQTAEPSQPTSGTTAQPQPTQRTEPTAIPSAPPTVPSVGSAATPLVHVTPLAEPPVDTVETTATSMPVQTSEQPTTFVPPSLPSRQPSSPSQPDSEATATPLRISFADRDDETITGNEAWLAPLTFCFYPAPEPQGEADQQGFQGCEFPYPANDNVQPKIEAGKGLTSDEVHTVALIQFSAPVSSIVVNFADATNYQITSFDRDQKMIATNTTSDNPYTYTMLSDRPAAYLAIKREDDAQFWIAWVDVFKLPE